MKIGMIFRSLVFTLLAAVVCYPQVKKYGEAPSTPLLARISYQSSFVAGSGDSPHICIALYENGLYRLSKVGADKSDLLPSPILQGTLTKEELDRFVALLHNLRSNYRQDGIVREGTASFVAELTSNGKPVRYIWTDADHRDPFPGSIRKVVHWMQDFKAEDSTVITLHELSSIPSPCPSLNEKSFQPVIAGLNPDQTGGSCRAKR